jgi:hypothetical protein
MGVELEPYQLIVGGAWLLTGGWIAGYYFAQADREHEGNAMAFGMGLLIGFGFGWIGVLVVALVAGGIEAVFDLDWGFV